MNPVGVFIPVEDVFEGTENSFQTFRLLLENLSLTDTLFWCARLNLIVSNPVISNQLVKQQYGLNVIFTPDEIRKINNFAEKHGGAANVAVFFRGQLLELLRWVSLFCKDHPNDGLTFDDPEIRRTFAKALLLAGDLWSRRIYGERFSLQGGIDLARLRGLGAMRGAIAETSCGIDPSHALGRGLTIFGDYFPKGYLDFEKDFTGKAGLSLADYYLCLSAMIANFVERAAKTVAQGAAYSGLFNIMTFCDSVAPEVRPLFSQYISLESQTPEDLRDSLWGQPSLEKLSGSEPYDLKPLRERPILRVSDGRAIIVDPVFYTEKATVGPLFLLTAGLPDKRSNQIFGAFGTSFESYTNNIFQRMYPDTNGMLAKRFRNQLPGRDRSGNEIEITDGCLEDVSEVVFFETKAVWVRDSITLDENHELFLDRLRAQYGHNPKGQERAKGYAQLARVIRNVARGEWVPADTNFKEIKKIYPVLLVYDSLLDTPVVCHFLNSEFQKLLEPDETLSNGLMWKGRFLVAPLIVMTVDELEALETSVEHFRLIDLFRDYTASCPDRIVSLNNFIAATEPYKSHMYANPTLVLKASELLKKTAQKLFRPVEDHSAS
jgi:hypothetical protein